MTDLRTMVPALLRSASRVHTPWVRVWLAILALLSAPLLPAPVAADMAVSAGSPEADTVAAGASIVSGDSVEADTVPAGASVAAPDSAVAAAESATADSLWVLRPLARIEITGLRETRAEVVRRELTVAPGVPADSSALERDRLRLLDLDLFAEVDFELRPDPETDGPVLFIEVAERPTFLAYPVLEYDPEDRFTYGLYASTLNLWGRNQRAGISGLLGGRRGISLWYSTPWTAGKRLATGLSLYLQRRRLRTEKLLETRAGGSVSVQPGRNPQTGLPLAMGWEEVRTRPDGEGAAQEGTRIDDHRWAGFGLWRDTRDYRARPMRGTRAGIGFVQHGGILGGDTSMERYSLDLLWVLSTGGETALTAATRTVWSRGAVPRYLRMNLGGTNTLRGHAQGEYGGESRWNAWLEQRFPLLAKRTFSVWKGRYMVDVTVDWTLFADAGAIWEGDELQEGKAVARFGGGIGLRIVAPLFRVVRLELATDGETVRLQGQGGVRL